MLDTNLCVPPPLVSLLNHSLHQYVISCLTLSISLTLSHYPTSAAFLFSHEMAYYVQGIPLTEENHIYIQNIHLPHDLFYLFEKNNYSDTGSGLTSCNTMLVPFLDLKISYSSEKPKMQQQCQTVSQTATSSPEFRCSSTNLYFHPFHTFQ